MRRTLSKTHFGVQHVPREIGLSGNIMYIVCWRIVGPTLPNKRMPWVCHGNHESGLWVISLTLYLEHQLRVRRIWNAAYFECVDVFEVQRTSNVSYSHSDVLWVRRFGYIFCIAILYVSQSGGFCAYLSSPHDRETRVKTICIKRTDTITTAVFLCAV